MTPHIHRPIHDHKVTDSPEALQVVATDLPGPGGANHFYRTTGFTRWEYSLDEHGNPVREAISALDIVFQNGPIKEAGVTGVTNESVLAVVIDRLRGFQHKRKEDGSFDFNSRGEFACRENAVALTHLEDALLWLQKRTRDRLARGVEGTNVQ